MERLTKLQIIDETVKYYSEDINRRAINGNACYYYHPENGNMCAVGRCLRNASLHKDSGQSARYFLKNQLMLKPEYRGHSLDFWAELQALHDSGSCWSNNGLSLDGEYFVKKLKDKWKD